MANFKQPSAHDDNYLYYQFYSLQSKEYLEKSENYLRDEKKQLRDDKKHLRDERQKLLFIIFQLLFLISIRVRVTANIHPLYLPQL